MFKNILIILVLLCLSYPTQAYIIDSLIIKGNTSVSSIVLDSIFSYLKYDTLESSKEDELAFSLMKKYEDFTTFTAGIYFNSKNHISGRNFSNKNHKILEIIITESPFIYNIRIDTLSFLSTSKIDSILALKIGKAWNKDKLSLNLKNLSNYCKKLNKSITTSYSITGTFKKSIEIKFKQFAIKEKMPTKIYGNSFFKDNVLLNSIKNLDIFSSIQTIKKLYHTKGFFDIKFNFKINNNDLSIYIIENNRSKISNIEINSPVLKKELYNLLKTFDFKDFDTLDISLISITCSDFFTNNGYPFCKVFSNEFERDSLGNIILIYTIEPGQYFLFGDIHFLGNTKTKSNILKNVANINKGNKFSAVILNNANKRINKLGFIKIHKKTTLSIPKGRQLTDIFISVKETPNNIIEGILGLSKNSEKNDISGNFKLELDNIYGTGRKFGFNYFNEIGITRMNTQFTEPWLLGTSISLKGDLLLDLDTSNYSVIRGTLQLGFPIKEYGETFISFSKSSSNFKIINYDSSNYTIGYWDKYSSKLGFILSDVYPINNPLNGKKVQISSKFSQKSDSTGVSPQFTIEGSMEFFSEYIENHVIHLKYRGAVLLSSRDQIINQSELFRLGGINNLRGYDENSFFGKKFQIATFEYRLILNRSSYFLLFFDSGNESTYINLKDYLKQQKSSLGFGVSFDTDIVSGGFIYGLAIGNSFLDGKIHAKLVKKF